MTSQFHKVMTLFLFVAVAAAGMLLFSAQSASAHCTGYHPYHCKPKDLDPSNKNGGVNESLNKAEEQVRERAAEVEAEVRDILTDPYQKIYDMSHLGGQGCRAKANSVMASHVSHRGLTDLEKYYLEPEFGDDIDLDAVRVAWGANLNNEMKIGNWTVWVAADAQTFGYNLFFSEEHYSGYGRQLISLAHELVHTKQYVRSGSSLLEFCQNYMDGYAKAGFDYHDNPMEESAYDAAFKYATWLSKTTLTNGATDTYEHGMPNNYRTVEIPEWVLLPTNNTNADGTGTTGTQPPQNPPVQSSPQPKPAPQQIGSQNACIEGLYIVDARADQPLFELADGQTINRSTTPDKVNIRAVPGSCDVDSMEFLLTGAKRKPTTENHPPYALFGNNSGSFEDHELPAGQYNLSISLYSQDFAGGQQIGQPHVLTFSVR